ncbi:UPF0149 family protein [Spongiibacter sp. KMU-158]|uniref:UPF0149 family protein n=1 Tax=Spongiibacter pelagi TaxID=2760804 RepID=A0A927C0E2_9GAMM|nr:UPF0149 family protein [Spongiibacter pelagi]MBD2857873.1 UPF0149 family protein [Spongiibacter pelagi]
MAQQLDHDGLADIFLALGALSPPAELHGYASGYVAAGGKTIAEEAWPQHCMELLDCEQPNPEQAVELYRVYSSVKQDLTSNNMDFLLLLPGEEFELGLRLASLGQWCQGFLTGFAMAGKQRLAEKGSSKYSDELTEALGDIAAIAQISEDEAGDEQGEQDFFAICEYLRVVTMTIYAECVDLSAQQPASGRLH